MNISAKEVARRATLKEVMSLAAQFVAVNGFTSWSACMRLAWRNVKLHKEMQTRICKFYFKKVDGTTREAYGTLNLAVVPATNGTRVNRSNTVQTYFDTEKQEWRCFKKANLLQVE